MLEVGATVPALTIPDDTGVPASLADLGKGRLVLWFYPKADTPG